MQYFQGDIVKLKKGHPCGSNEWMVIRTGVDMKLICQGCQKELWIKRIVFNKTVRKIKDENGKFVSVQTFERKDMH